MRYTLEEKYRYNKRRKSSFSSGYVTKACLASYLALPTEIGFDPNMRRHLSTYVSVGEYVAVTYCKGLLCGYHDAADARKNTARKEGIRR